MGDGSESDFSFHQERRWTKVKHKRGNLSVIFVYLDFFNRNLEVWNPVHSEPEEAVSQRFLF